MSDVLSSPALVHRTKARPGLSAHREELQVQNEAFLDGVCHAIDVLREIGRDRAADALERRLFVKREVAR